MEGFSPASGGERSPAVEGIPPAKATRTSTLWDTGGGEESGHPADHSRRHLVPLLPGRGSAHRTPVSPAASPHPRAAASS
ncbi:hypothetical protein GN956_G26202 [Arapaima gigas]